MCDFVSEADPKYVEIANWLSPENLFHFKLNAALLTRQLRKAEFQFHLSCGVLQELKSFTAVIEVVLRDKNGYRSKKVSCTFTNSEVTHIPAPPPHFCDELITGVLVFSGILSCQVVACN